MFVIVRPYLRRNPIVRHSLESELIAHIIFLLGVEDWLVRVKVVSRLIRPSLKELKENFLKLIQFVSKIGPLGDDLNLIASLNLRVHLRSVLVFKKNLLTWRRLIDLVKRISLFMPLDQSLLCKLHSVEFPVNFPKVRV